MPLVEPRHQSSLLVDRHQQGGRGQSLEARHQRRQLGRGFDVAHRAIGRLVGIEEEDAAEVSLLDVRHHLARFLDRQPAEAHQQHLADPIAQARTVGW
jgi:hypothetical protein